MCMPIFSSGPKKWPKINGKPTWCSNGKRFKAVRFRCAFCWLVKHNETYSIVDGGKSCKQCDEV